MYKLRIKKWHIGRNIKEPELQYMLRALAQRNLKPTEFRLRNRTVSIMDLEKYFTSRGRTLSHALRRQQSKSPVLAREDLRCYTPTPRIHRLDQDAPFEKMLCNISNYVAGSWQNGNWTLSENNEPISIKGDAEAVRIFADHMLQVPLLWMRKDCKGLAWNLAAASAKVADVVHAEAPETLRFLSIICVRNHEHPEIVQRMLKQMSAFIGLKHGQQHPLGHICAILLSTNRNDLPNLLSLSFRKYLEAWQGFLRPESPALILIQLQRLIFLVDCGIEDATNAAKKALELRGLMYGTSLSSTAPRLSIDLMSSYLLKKAGNMHLGWELFHSCLSEAEDASSFAPFGNVIRILKYRQIWNSYQSSGDLGLVKFFSEYASKYETEAKGPHFVGPIEFLIRLEMLLREQGRQEEADQLRAQICREREQADNPFV